MKFLGILFLSLASLLVAMLPPSSPPQWVRVDHFENGCLVAAAEVVQVLRQHGLWARVVRITLIAEPRGHAVAVYALPNGVLWGYDTVGGSYCLNTTHRDIASIQRGLRVRHPFIYSAKFID